MLTREINEKMTRTGPDTPMGQLLRRYWMPIAASVELQENPVKKVRVLCEDLVLYKDRSGNLGLIDEPCPHRRVSMEYGIPEEEGLRCPYHGWLFNAEGRCMEQPAEPWDSTFKDRVTTKAYPVQDFAGMIWAYMGPLPAPLIPHYDLFMWDNVIRQIGVTILPCNWIQCMENSLDPVHVEWLHGRFLEYAWERKGGKAPFSLRRRHKKIGFDRFEHGLIKRRVSEGGSEEDDAWMVGHPIVFPNILRVGGNGNYCFQYRVPIDDHNTYHIRYTVYRPQIAVPPQESIPLYEIPIKYPDGKYVTDVVLPQDFFAWATQGSIARRDLEHLGQSDVGVIMYRELLLEQLARVERGEEPNMEVYRDPAKNVLVDIVQEQSGPRQGFSDGHIDVSEAKFSPIVGDIIAVFDEERERAARGEPLLPPWKSPRYPPGQVLHREVYILPESV